MYILLLLLYDFVRLHFDRKYTEFISTGFAGPTQLYIDRIDRETKTKTSHTYYQFIIISECMCACKKKNELRSHTKDGGLRMEFTNL